MMVEYGYRYEDPEIGVFRSRFDHNALDRLDQQRGAEIAALLDEFREDGDWQRFRRIYTVPKDAYIHEIGTHLFRRNRHLGLARDESRTGWQRRDSYLIAQKENMILERYFQESVNHSIHNWNPATRAEVDSGARESHAYVSAVSRNLITEFSEGNIAGGLAAATALMLVVGILCGRRSGRPYDMKQQSGPE